VQTRDFDPTLTEKAGMDFKFTAIWYALAWENLVLVTRTRKFNAQFMKVMETKNPRKSSLASKVVNPFTRARAPPFIGRPRDFYIPKIPSKLGNIPNVNMYTNIFYNP
jgi:hypothetical protein